MAAVAAVLLLVVLSYPFAIKHIDTLEEFLVSGECLDLEIGIPLADVSLWFIDTGTTISGHCRRDHCI